MAARASTCYDCGFWVRTDRQVDRASTWSLLLKSPAPFSCRFAPGGQHIVVKTPPARPNWRESAQLPGERTASSSADQDPTSQKVRKTPFCYEMDSQFPVVGICGAPQLLPSRENIRLTLCQCKPERLHCLSILLPKSGCRTKAIQ